MDLRSRLIDFADSLEKYPPREHPASQVADIFNALLAAVKEAHPDDPVVSAISPAGETRGGNSAMDAGSLIAATQQLVGAVPDDSGPPFA